MTLFSFKSTHCTVIIHLQICIEEKQPSYFLIKFCFKKDDYWLNFIFIACPMMMYLKATDVIPTFFEQNLMRKFDYYFSSICMYKCVMVALWVVMKLKSVILENSSYYFYKRYILMSFFF